MQIEQIETEIIKKLKALDCFDGFQIEPFPVDFEKFAFTSGKGCVLVRYDGSDYTKPQTLNVVTQDETLDFSIIIGLRYLKLYRNSYLFLENIKHSLTGLKIGGKKLYPKKREFVNKIRGDLYWGYVFSITLPTQEISDSNNIDIPPLWERQHT